MEGASSRAPGAWALIGLVSALALAALFYLIYGRSVQPNPDRLTFLPAVNAACNAAASFLIVQGLIRIHHGDERGHRRSMLGAFAASTLFLIGYVLYHAFHGDTRFQGQGLIRPVYFFILISHILLSMAALPMVLGTFYLALSGRLSAHRKLARFTYPIWLYVSVTGVAIFGILKMFPG